MGCSGAWLGLLFLCLCACGSVRLTLGCSCWVTCAHLQAGLLSGIWNAFAGAVSSVLPGRSTFSQDVCTRFPWVQKELPGLQDTLYQHVVRLADQARTTSHESEIKRWIGDARSDLASALDSGIHGRLQAVISHRANVEHILFPVTLLVLLSETLTKLEVQLKHVGPHEAPTLLSSPSAALLLWLGLKLARYWTLCL